MQVDEGQPLGFAAGPAVRHQGRRLVLKTGIIGRRSCAAAEVGGPVVHQAAPPLEQVRPGVGGLDLVLDHVGERASPTSRGWFVSSTAQSRKLDRKPCNRRIRLDTIMNR